MSGLFGNTVLKRKWKREALEKIKDRPILLAYGMGVDSTAMLMGMHDRGIRPDVVLFADTKGEGDGTYPYRRVINRWLKRKGWPQVIVVTYKPKKFKNYPPYGGLEENCLSNGTLPSLAFGFKSCSLKWKAAPQESWCRQWRPALETWGRGQRVVKLIGYDAGPADMRRGNHAGNDDDQFYEYRYPLQEWDWSRDYCIERVRAEGLPGWNPAYLEHRQPVMDTWRALIQSDFAREAWKSFSGAVKALRRDHVWIRRGGIPMKSSCFFCPAMKIWEVCLLTKEKLQRIVMMEARAKPRLETCQGLWRSATKIKPGSISEFIELGKLLPAREMKRIRAQVPKHLRRTVEKFREGMPVESWEEFFENVGVKPMGFCGDFDGE